MERTKYTDMSAKDLQEQKDELYDAIIHQLMRGGDKILDELLEIERELTLRETG